MENTVSKKVVYGLRLDEKLIEDYKQACQELPLHFKPVNLIESYMEYIILSAKQFKQTGQLQLGFLSKEGAIILYDMAGKQTRMEFLE